MPVCSLCPKRVICGRRGRPALMSALGHVWTAPTTGIAMSGFGGKADVNHCVGECPLIAISGHPAARVYGKPPLNMIFLIQPEKPLGSSSTRYMRKPRQLILPQRLRRLAHPSAWCLYPCPRLWRCFSFVVLTAYVRPLTPPKQSPTFIRRLPVQKIQILNG